ncbi:MAG: hypothetical protein ACOZNI_12985 [Myxococcota bacterium]
MTGPEALAAWRTVYAGRVVRAAAMNLERLAASGSAEVLTEAETAQLGAAIRLLNDIAGTTLDRRPRWP